MARRYNHPAGSELPLIAVEARPVFGTELFDKKLAVAVNGKLDIDPNFDAKVDDPSHVGMSNAARQTIVELPKKVTLTVGEHGSVSAFIGLSPLDLPAIVEPGYTVTFEAHPAQGYMVDTWSGLPQGTSSSFDERWFIMGHEPVNASVTFKVAPTLTFSAGEHGSITGKVGTDTVTSPVNVNPSSYVELTASPAEGYEVDAWSGLPTGYETEGNVVHFPMPNAAVTASVTFKAVGPSYDYENTDLECEGSPVDITNTPGASALYDPAPSTGDEIQVHLAGVYGGELSFDYTGPMTVDADSQYAATFTVTYQTYTVTMNVFIYQDANQIKLTLYPR